MGVCRQARKSEQVFDQVVKGIRNLDKLLWNGEAEHLQDVEDLVHDLQRDLVMVLKHFKDEVSHRELETLVRSVIPEAPVPAPAPGPLQNTKAPDEAFQEAHLKFHAQDPWQTPHGPGASPRKG